MTADNWGGWAVSGNTVFYIVAPQVTGQAATIRSIDLTTRQTRTLRTLSRPPVRYDGSLAVSPDGRWLYYTTLDYAGSDIYTLQ